MKMMNSPRKVPPAAAPRNLSLDGLRGIACLLVYFFHTGFNFRYGPIVLVGSAGVHIFFVLSGFLMFGPFLPSLLGKRPPPSLWRYMVRRTTRIYPPFLVSLICFTAIRYAIGIKPPSVRNVALHGLLVFNYFDPSYYMDINGVYWTLAIEAQFYVLLPLVLIPLAKHAAGRPAIAIALFMSVGIISRYLESHMPSNSRWASFQSLLSHLDMFGLGMAAAWISHRDGERIARSAPIRWGIMVLGVAILLGFSSWIALQMQGSWHTGSSRLEVTIASFGLCLGPAMIVLSAVNWPGGGPVLLTNRPIVWVGMVSYSLYLYHMATQIVTIQVVKYERLAGEPFYLNSFLMALCALPLSLSVSALMYYLVEAPAMRWGQRYSQHLEGVSARAAG
jgi:peptidoglycan/LPS O-acetylase OafA/YrhL